MKNLLSISTAVVLPIFAVIPIVSTADTNNMQTFPVSESTNVFVDIPTFKNQKDQMTGSDMSTVQTQQYQNTISENLELKEENAILKNRIFDLESSSFDWSDIDSSALRSVQNAPLVGKITTTILSAAEPFVFRWDDELTD